MADDENFDIETYSPVASNKSTEHGFGLYTIKCLFKLLKIIFSKKVCIVLVVLICVMALIEQFLVYQVGLVPSRFYVAFGNKNWTSFWSLVINASLLITALCFVLGCKKYIIKVFYISSRQALTGQLHRLYFEKNKFYFLNTFKYTFADNPDQRITQDIDKFCNQFSSIVNPFVISPFTIAYYSYNCYVTTGWIGPVSIFGYFLLSAILNKLMMKPIITRVMLQEKFEGFFRFKHMHVRTNAEPIAFQDASFTEMNRANSKLSTLINMQLSLSLREFPLEIAVKISSYFGSILSYLILAYPVFSGKYDNLSPVELSEIISKNAFVSMYLISCFSSLINLSSTLSEIGGLTHRVYELLDILNADKRSEDKYSDSKLILKPGQCSDDSQDYAFKIKDVTIRPPKEVKPLIRNLCLEIALGKNLLISGNSSSGKTSIFRVIKGLWPVYSGQVIKRMYFCPSSVFFLPQQSLLSDGTLLGQIVYPLDLPELPKMKDEDSALVLRYLKVVDLEHLLEKAGLNSEVDWNWYDILSPGEAQRLSFVRLFYHKPKLAFVDEATSALGLEMETKIYKMCKELGITMVSIGHRESLVQYHDIVLHLDGEGGWTITPTQSSNSL